MGSGPRERPERLAEKLYQVRARLNLSQTQMRDYLGLPKDYHHSLISLWERGLREPPLTVLLKYARAVPVAVDVMIDDELDLPSPKKHRSARTS